jgi:hypothetical protein
MNVANLEIGRRSSIFFLYFVVGYGQPQGQAYNPYGNQPQQQQYHPQQAPGSKRLFCTNSSVLRDD